MLWLTIFLISLISLLAVYSSTSALAFKFKGGATEYYLVKHFVLLGLSQQQPESIVLSIFLYYFGAQSGWKFWKIADSRNVTESALPDVLTQWLYLRLFWFRF